MSRIPKIELIEEIKVRDIENQNPPPTPKTKNSIDNEWSIGCLGKLDRRCVMFFSQMTILGLCIGVSLYQVSTTNGNRDFWVSLLSTCCGVLMPNPKLSKKD
jgi:hypothetical protein